jgi:hypothetical protein
MRYVKGIAIIIALVIQAMMVVAVPAVIASPSAGISNLDRLFLADSSTGAILKVNQKSTGNIAQFDDNGTPVFQFSDGGHMQQAMPTAIGTATPGVLINNAGGLSNPIEVRKNATPVFYVDADGNVTYTGMTSAGGLTNAAAGVVAPTAVGTATPAFFADSLGVSNLFEVRDAGTPVVQINNGGNGTFTGGQTVNNWVIASAPTDIATATPVMVVDSLGVSNILEVRDAATPVFSVNNGGAVVAANGQTISAGGLTVTAGGVTVTAGGLDVAAGDVFLSNGWVNLAANTFIVTDTLPITPTGTFMSLSSTTAAACSTSNCIEDGTTVGDLLILQNTNASDAITIDGTGGNVECKADVILGAQDTLWLMWNGDDWICLATYDNS